MMTQPHIPSVMSDLRQDIVQMPEVIKECSGIRIYGRRIRSILFTTDVSIIANHDADAILAVYPFTPVPAIIKSIMMVASVPVLAGVGGGLTTGMRSANMSLLSESEGAYAVVVNGPTTVETIEEINKVIDIPIIYTVVSDKSDIKSRIEAGVDILNVSCGVETPKVVEKNRKEREEDIIADTFSCPLQKIKTFEINKTIDHKEFIREPETKKAFSNNWYNKLIF